MVGVIFIGAGRNFLGVYETRVYPLIQINLKFTAGFEITFEQSCFLRLCFMIFFVR